jgi:hypothetical protein
MEESSLFAHYESQESWKRARRGALVQRVVCAFKSCAIHFQPSPQSSGSRFLACQMALVKD